VRFLVDGEDLGDTGLDAVMKRVPIGCGRTFVGSAPGGTVAGAFAPPYPFTGTIERLVVTPYVDSDGRPLDEELAAEMREQ
jgi:hypothetical protein